MSARNIGGCAQISNQYATVELDTVGGSTTVANEHGRVSVVNVAKQADIRTSFADIDIQDVKGGVTAHSQHGSIAGNRIQGATKAETSFGGIELTAQAAEVVCKNHHGSIRLVLLSPELRRIQAETSFGPLEVMLAPTIVPTIDAQAVYGNVRSDFPVRQVGTAVENVSDREDDSPRLTLQNSHGDVTIRKATAETPM